MTSSFILCLMTGMYGREESSPTLKWRQQIEGSSKMLMPNWSKPKMMRLIVCAFANVLHVVPLL